MITWIKNKWQRFKKWSTVDHWIDLFVDIGLIAFDVLSSLSYTNSGAFL